MADPSAKPHVIVDANILINLMRVGRLDLLEALNDRVFIISERVFAEMTYPEHRAPVQQAINDGVLQLVRLTEAAGLATFVALVNSGRIEEGEAECLALAELHGWMLLSDEKKVFRPEAIRRLGADRLTGTVGVLLWAVRADLITVADGDAIMAELATKRFRDKDFTTFADLV